MSEYELYLSGLSIPEVSKITKIPLSTLRFRFKSKKILRDRAAAVRLAHATGKVPSRKGIKRGIRTQEWIDNLSASLRKRGEKFAKGFSLKPSGYYEVTRGENKGRSVHVVIMEKHIGRKLFYSECVHHIDQCKTNNDLSNLQLMTKSEHNKLHRQLDKINNKQIKRSKNGRFY